MFDKVKPEELYKAIKQELADYSKEVVSKVEDVSERVAEEVVEKIRDTAHQEFGGTGKYAEGWTFKEESKGTLGTLRIKGYVIYNKDHYQLTHLLEFPHLDRTGTKQVYDGRPHIKPAEEWAIEELPKQIMEELGG